MAHGPLKSAFFLLCIPLAITLVFYFISHTGDDEISLKDDLVMAEMAAKSRDIGDAEMFYERYLRKNPTGDQRWNVWQNLLNISLNIRQDKITAKDYLEIMLLEYDEEPVKRRDIQMELAAVSNDLRMYERAVTLWEKLVEDEGTPDEDKAAFYRALSHAYMRRLEFTMATDVLELCLKLNVSLSTKADCLYDVGEAEMITGNMAESEKALRSLLAMPEATPQRRVLAVFMLADVLEQQNRPEEAVKLFESIRESYPNTRVVEMRIAALRGKQAPKKPDVVPVRKRTSY